MDAGWATTLEAGLEIEQAANREHSAREVTPDRVASRRRGIQDRGRQQS